MVKRGRSGASSETASAENSGHPGGDLDDIRRLTDASDCGIETRELNGALHLTLNRPEKRNALTVTMFERLRDVLSSAAAEPPRVLTLSAVGPAFCAGGDLGEMTALVGKPPELVRQRAHLAADVVRRLALFPAPTVAVVRGQAVGGGACLALACDRVLASEDAVLDLPFARLGTAGSDMLAPWMLTRRVGTRAALQLLLDGARLPASEALRRGLLDEVLPSPKLDNRVRSCVELWASGHPAGTRATKAAVLALETSAWDVDRQLEFEARLVAGVLSEGEQLHRPAVHNGQSGAS